METKKKVAGFVGAHIDDIELGCAGTLQILKKRGYEAVGLVLSNHPAELVGAAKESAEALGYKLVLGNIPIDELTEKIVFKTVAEKLVQVFYPSIIFGHSPKDNHIDHQIVSRGTDSACRAVRNLLHYSGPLSKFEFNENVFFTFFEEEYKKKKQVLDIFSTRKKARYLTESYLQKDAWLGQQIYEYKNREEMPFIKKDGKKIIPYVEGFEARKIRDPF